MKQLAQHPGKFVAFGRGQPVQAHELLTCTGMGAHRPPIHRLSQDYARFDKVVEGHLEVVRRKRAWHCNLYLNEKLIDLLILRESLNLVMLKQLTDLCERRGLVHCTEPNNKLVEPIHGRRRCKTATRKTIARM